MTEIAHRFHDLFAGLERGHGAYEMPTVPGPNGKMTGDAVWLAEPVTDALWAAHLAGTDGLGITPIRDDSTCVFGAVDIDTYADFDPAGIAVKLLQLSLPLIVCRSKSGGAHAYLFTSEPVPAAKMRTRLREIAVMLGHPKVEVFPKQSELNGGKGNWINMPYSLIRDML